MPKQTRTAAEEEVKSSGINDKLNVLIRLLRNRHQRHYRDSDFHLWADILLASILIGMGVILVWLMFWQPQPDFELEVKTASASVVSARSQEFIVSYKNDEGTAVSGANVLLDLPANFIVESATPATIFEKDSARFNIGDLAKNERGELRIRGIVQGAIGDRQFLGLTMSYLKGQVRKQVLSSIVYHIDASALDVSLDIPANAYRGIPLQGSIEVKNTGDVTLENAFVAFSGGWDINPQELSFENNRIVMHGLAPGESRHFQFTATTAQAALTEVDFTVEGSLLAGTDYVLQVQKSSKVSILEPSLNVVPKFKENSWSGGVLNLGINFRNSEKTPITNIKFKLNSRRATTAVKSFATVDKGFSMNDNGISFPSLLDSGTSVSLNSTVELDRKQVELNDFLNLELVVSYTRDSQEYNYAIALPVLKIDTNISVQSAGYYYGPQGDQLGIGPIPPKVGIPTTYWVIWEINNLGNDIANFEVSADLQPNVVWLEQTSLIAGSASYSPVGRRVLWNLDSISKTGGNYRLSFAVSIVPAESDLGKVPNLLTNIQFKGKDSYSGAVISKKLANINTNIESDRKAGGKGTVESFE